MFIRCSSWAIKNPVGKMNLKFRKKVEVGDINLGVISKKVAFRVMSLDEIIRGVSADREEKRTNKSWHTSDKEI